ncbi:MAG: Chemotaxis response regulator protein-glutamate methylesterase CheB [Ignavibacteriae bacterium]|nr:MAG: Chemotaxis response regulator protein-glutamate methylesterase CheB [Ignavibacteriota bacterium]
MEKLNILVVDDSQSFREIITEFLKEQNEVGEVLTAKSGNEAIELLKKFLPNVILMDIVMPGLNGFETSEIIRKEHPLIPIIVLSGNEITDADEMVKKLNLNGYISKLNIMRELMPMIFKSIRKN